MYMASSRLLFDSWWSRNSYMLLAKLDPRVEDTAYLGLIFAIPLASSDLSLEKGWSFGPDSESSCRLAFSPETPFPSADGCNGSKSMSCFRSSASYSRSLSSNSRSENRRRRCRGARVAGTHCAPDLMQLEQGKRRLHFTFRD